MPAADSVSHWLRQLKGGDHAAAQKLWERYFHRLVGLARKKLQDTRRRAADEEDVALSAFTSFCKVAEAGRYPQLLDRDDLWRLLVTITARKAFDQVRQEHCQKRGGGAVLGESALARPGREPEEEAGLEQIVGQEPTPAFAAQVAEECRRLLDCLDSDELRSIALCKLEGDTTEQIADKLGCAPSTVDRKLQRIRKAWGRERPTGT